MPKLADYGKVPLSFEPNRGQTDGRVQWVARGPEYALFLSGHDAVLELNSIAPKKEMTDRPKIDSAAVRMNLLGAKAVKETKGEEPQPGKANYFTGRDQTKWQSEVPMFGKVRLREVYPGIDLVYYGRQGRLEYDFVVSPGADPAKIALGFEGAKAGLAANGDLVLPFAGGEESLRPTSQNRDFGMGHPESVGATSPKEVRFDRPTVYQMKGGVREPVAGAFRVAKDGRVSFALGKYDRSRELVIDPTLVFEGEIGTGNQQTIPTGMTVDSAGEMVITGYTNDLTFPVTTGAYQTTCSSPTDPLVTNGGVRCGVSSAPSAFVTKLSQDGTTLIYSTYLHGGGGYEQGSAVVTDAAGDAYVLGSTSSNDFPITSNAYQTTCQPTATGTNGAPVSQCDNFSNGGGTEYTVNGPTLFIAKLNPLGTALLYSTFFGGTGAIYPVGLALDSAENMVFASSVNPAYSTNNSYPNNQAIQFPVTLNAYQTTGINVLTPALSKLSADGQTLLYSTFLGSQSLNIGHNSNNQAFALGQNGIAFIGGYTETSDFPTTAGAFQPACAPYADDSSYCNTNMGFVAAIDTTKSGTASLVYASYLGGVTPQGSNIPEQEVYGLAADANNDLFVTGYTYSAIFPTTEGAFQTNCPVQSNSGSCPETAFLSKINPAGNTLTWSTFVGGTSTNPANSYGNAIAQDSAGNVYLYGFSQDGGGDFPQVNPLQTYTGGNKVFVTTFTPDGKTELFGTRFGTSSTTSGSGTSPIANGISVDATGNMYIVGYTNDNGTFGTTPGTYSTPATNGFNRTFFAKISPATAPVPSNGLTTNLLLNPGAELGSIVDWTPGGGGTPTVDTGTFDSGINPHTGSYDFVGGKNTPPDSLSQTVSLLQQGITATQVDGGTLFANVSFWEQGLNQGTPSDDASVTLTFLNANNAAISTASTVTEDDHDGTWANVTGLYAIPVGTRSITYTMNFIRNVGNNNDAFIDDNVLYISTNTGLTIFPSTLHFGNVPVGQLSQSQTATVTNNQTTAITIDQIISELGANPSEFGVSTYCPQGYSLAAGASCPVTITFAPKGVGPKSAGIAISTESVPALQQIAVDGTGTGGILQVDPGNLKTIAGNGTDGDTGDGGAAIAAEMEQPNGVAFDPSGNLYIADTEANVVRKVAAGTGIITTFAGDGTGGFAGDGGPATQAELLIPFSVASDKNGNIYIQDTGNSVIRKVNATTGVITTVAGTPGMPGRSGDGGPATAAKLNENQGARFDSAGNFYVALCPTGSIRKIDTAGVITTVAGTPGTPGFSGDGGQATAAQLQCPSGVTIDAAGNFYIADEFNQVIRKVNTQGVISTIAGTPGVAGSSGDGGAATSATFNDPNDVVVDSLGNLYVADSGNNRVRKIDTNGIITTAAGGLNSAGSAAVNTPLAVTVDPANNVYFSDSGNSKIEEIFPQGVQPFPATMVGSTAPAKTLTLSNIGNVDVALQSEAALTTSGNTGDFALSGGTCANGIPLTANGGSCTLSITFTPTAVGQRTLTVTIADNALNTPQSFSIGGLGTSPASAATPTITWPTPAAITDTTPLSATQLDATATDASGNAVPGTFAYTPAAETLLAVGTQTLSVTFTPNDQIAFRAVTKTVQIVVNFSPNDTLSPSVVVFPSEVIGATSKAVTINVIVASNVPQSYISVTGDFAQTNNCASAQTNNYSYNTLCLIQVTFTPTATGTRTGTLSVTPTGGTALTVPLSGAGLAAGTLPGTTSTALGVTGTAGNYTFTGTVTGNLGVGAPTGPVSFVDTTASNALLGTGTLGAATIATGLANGPSTTTGYEPDQIATADFNGDGKMDVVVQNSGNPAADDPSYCSLNIRISNGDGTFTAKPDLSPGYCAGAMAVGDFNGDGKADIALSPSGGSFIVYFGNGDGTFTAKTFSFTGGGSLAYGAVAADFNGDGKSDLLVETEVATTTNGNTVYTDDTTILLGQGDETFVTGVTSQAAATNGLVVADFNGDGKQDLAAASPDGTIVYVSLGNGDGTFQAAVSTPLPTQSNFILGGLGNAATGDFNGDGKADLVLPGALNEPYRDAFLALVSKGDGTFTVGSIVATSTAAQGTSNDANVTVGDFNGDGLADIAYLDDFAAQIFLSNGDGTFTLGGHVDSGDYGTGSADYLPVAAADFNGDGLADIIGVDSDTLLATVYFTQRRETATASLANVAVPGSGNHLVEAVYGGGSNFLTSTSPTVTVTATQLAQTITFGALSNQTYPGAPITLMATASSGLPVSYSVTGPATVSGSTLTITGVGSVTVTASQAGNATYAAATPVAQTFTVTQAGARPPATTTGLYTRQNTVAYRTPVLLIATVGTANYGVAVGQVIFCNAAEPECDAAHNLATAALNSDGNATAYVAPGPIGVNTFLAKFLGTTSGARPGAPSTSPPVTVTVTGVYPTTTTIAQSGAAGNYTLTGTVVGVGSRTLSPTGTVSFNDTTGSPATTLGTAGLGTAVAGLSFSGVSSAAGMENPQTRSAVGDFNGDGIPDLATANTAPDKEQTVYANTVTISLGNGDGTFTTLTTTPATGVRPESIVAADFNGDGKLDLATANSTDSTVTVLLGNGDGTFTAAASPATEFDPLAIVTGDFNGDGIPDLAVSGFNGVTILLGNGDGTFTASTVSLTGSLGPMAVGDFNGDGRLDLAVQNYYPTAQLQVLLGNGDGTFTAETPIAATGTGSNLNGVAVGDFNGDGITDLVVTDSGNNTVTVLLSKGDGTFTSIPVASATGAAPQDVQVADFNSDGIQDLAVLNFDGGVNGETVLLGNGDGTFTSAALPTGVYAYDAVAVGDFNGDGVPDIAGTNGSTYLQIALTQLTQTAVATVMGIAPAGAGTRFVVASYPGDGSFGASVSSATSLAGAGPGTPVTPVITWVPAVATIPYGTALGVAQLDATAADANGNAVPGTFVYTPPAGAYLAAGTQVLSVTFTPMDTTDFATATQTTTIVVTQAALAPTTGVLAPISFGAEAIASSTALQTATVPFHGTVTIGSIKVLTGGAPNLDFQAAPSNGGSCQPGATYSAGQNCTVNAVFKPTAPGERAGAIVVTAADQEMNFTGTAPDMTLFYGGPPYCFYSRSFTNIAMAFGVDLASATVVSGQLSFTNQESGLNGCPYGPFPVINNVFNLTSAVFDGSQLTATFTGAASNDALLAPTATFTGTLSGTTIAGTFNVNRNGLQGTDLYFQLFSTTTLSSSNNAPSVLPVKTLSTVYLSGLGNGAQAGFTPGLISTIAGSLTATAPGDGGPATAAQVAPYQLALDGSNNLYFADENTSTVRKVSNGTVQEVAGNGTIGFSGDGGPALNAQLGGPIGGVAIDGAGNLFLADSNNDVVRRVDAQSGIITTVAGTPGSFSFAGDGGPALSASFASVAGVAVDSLGDLYIADTNSGRIRRVDAVTHLISTVAGDGNSSATAHGGDGGLATLADLAEPATIALDGAGDLYVADYSNCAVRKIDATTKIISLYAGNYTCGYLGDGGAATSAELNNPAGMVADAAGNLYIADSYEAVVRKVNGSTGVITTVAGQPNPSSDGSGNSQPAKPSSGDGGPATSAYFQSTYSLVLDPAGDLYATDLGAVGAAGLVREVAAGAAPLSFAALPAGQVSPAQTVLFGNTGNVPLLATALNLPANFSQASGGAVPCSASTQLAAAKECNVSVAFSPVVSGPITGNVTLVDNALASPQSIAVSGTGVALATSVSVAPPAASVYGSTISLAATVVGQGTLPVTGSVTFLSGTVPLGMASITTPGTTSTAVFSTTALPAGADTITAAYSGDSAYSSSTSLPVVVTVTPFTPVLTWATPGAITTATPLSAAQLDAAAATAAGVAIPGTFTYSPAAGTVLPVGTQTLSVTFTPTDSTDFTTATDSVQIVVTQAAAVTTTALAVTSGGAVATTVTAGSVVTLTAQVTAGGNSVSPGQVAFCDATATACTGIHLLATAELVGGDSTSTATYKFVPGIGAHSYKAVFLGTTTYAGSSSGAAALVVTGKYATTTGLAASGTQGSYALTATLGGFGVGNPSGSVVFTDSSTNGTLGTVPVTGVVRSLVGGTPIPSGANPSQVVAADVNGDGKPDLVVANLSGTMVTVLTGNGDGTYTALPSFGTNYNGITGVAVGDFNGDGKLDIATANGGSVGVFLGNGDGTFGAEQDFSTSNGAKGVFAADFNGDGRLDLAVTDDGYGVSILIGNGDGTFTQPNEALGTGAGPNFRLAVADFNGDGNLDIAIGNIFDDTVSILLGNGDGTFQPQTTVAAGIGPRATFTGDFNGDGKPDIFLTNGSGNSVSVLLGNGDGTFQPQQTYAVGANPYGASVGDLNGDGKLDIAVGNQNDGTVSILYGNGDGTFQTQQVLASGGGTDAVAIADLNGDGSSDLAAVNDNDSTATVFLNSAAAAVSLTGVTLPGSGSDNVVATYSGDTTFAGSTSNTLTLPSNPVATTVITWKPTTTTIVYGTALGVAELNATVATTAGVAIPGTFVYMPAAGTVLGAGTQTLSVAFTPTSSAYPPVTASVTITVTQAVPGITWAAPAAIAYGTPLSAAQLDATVAGVGGGVLPGTLVYTPPLGTVLTPGMQTLSVAFTPTDAVDYTTATATQTIVVGGLALTSFTPVGAVAGSGNTAITLTGTGFVATSVVMVNGTGVATTYVNPTTLTAVIPAALLAQMGTLAVTVLDPSLGTATAAQTFTVLPAEGAATLSGPTTTPPASQPTVTLSITNPYPLPVTAQFTLTFASAGTTPVDDPAIQFSTGGRTYSYTVAANSTSVPPVQLQAGTDAGTITIAAKLMADDVDVTPSGLTPLVIVVPPVVPVISGTTITASGTTLTVVIHGYSNTREVSSAVFDFTAATGDTLATPTVTIPATTIFSNWFGDATSDSYGSTFTYTQIFDTNNDASTVGSVKVTLTNSVGTSVPSTSP